VVIIFGQATSDQCSAIHGTVVRFSAAAICVLVAVIQCLVPPKPPKAYVVGGRWQPDGTRQFRYNDTATAQCAHGYYIAGTAMALTMNATCGPDGQWSRDLTKIDCVGTCVDCSRVYFIYSFVIL